VRPQPHRPPGVPEDRGAALWRNALKIVRECAAVAEGEHVAIVTDSPQPTSIALLLFDAVEEAGGVPLMLRMPELERPGSDLPPAASSALLHVDVVLAPTSKTVYHSPGVQDACRGRGHARFIALSECDEETLVHGGINADFVALHPIAAAVAERLHRGAHLHLTTPGGTRLEASIAGRGGGLIGGLSHEPGSMVGLPAVEAYTAPVEASVDGEIVVDASCSGGIGLIRGEPIRVRIEGGKATTIRGGRAAEELAALLDADGDTRARQVAEIALGLNPACRITGRIIEDEGKYGTCHVGLGSNVFIGGVNDAPVHIDLVQLTPTMVVDGETIMSAGELTIPDLDTSALTRDSHGGGSSQ
jgi:2,5-dihydroxypyridine 5,6-dioxygenase